MPGAHNEVDSGLKVENFPMVVPFLFLACMCTVVYSVTPLTDYSDGPNLNGREKIVSVSVAGCFPAVMNSRKAEGAVISTSRDARLAV